MLESKKCDSDDAPSSFLTFEEESNCNFKCEDIREYDDVIDPSPYDLPCDNGTSASHNHNPLISHSS